MKNLTEGDWSLVMAAISLLTSIIIRALRDAPL